MKQTQDEKEIWMSIIQMISFIGHSPELIHCDDNKEHLNPLTFSNEQFQEVKQQYGTQKNDKTKRNNHLEHAFRKGK